MTTHINDIAKEAGVSKATVSRVLNNFKNINPTTRKKVEAVIQKRGYKANPFASSISGKKHMDVAAVIGGIDSLFTRYYYRELIKETGKYLAHSEHVFFVYNLLDHDYEKFEDKIQLLTTYYQSRIIKGVILLAPVKNDIKLTLLSKNKVKGIAVGSKFDDPNFGFIDVDNSNGVAQIVSYLIEQGHQKIAIINGYPDLISATERKKAFYQTLKKHRIAIPKEYDTIGNYSREDGKKAATKLLKLKKPPTAIFAANDDMALGVYDAAKELHLTIPKDVSVAGFDNNMDIVSDLSPALATIAQPYEEIGKTIAQAFIEEHFTIKKEITPHLIKGRSVKKIN